MDPELKEYLESLKTDLQEQIRSGEHRTGTLVENCKESLEREIKPMRDSLQRIEARLDRQGGVI